MEGVSQVWQCGVPSALVTSTKHLCPLTSATQQGDLGC